MSTLSDGDRKYHYDDGSHRWIAPDGEDQKAWEAALMTHKQRHLDGEQTNPRPAPVPNGLSLPGNFRRRPQL